jgi:hypothetical protein
MRGWIDRTNDGLSGMPADSITLPPKKGDFGTSCWAARTSDYINGATGRKGRDRPWHKPVDQLRPLRCLFRGPNRVFARKALKGQY